jgi:glyoxylase-like metal-dependent hydrolase (beta-lactamase superfamily II)
MLDRRKFLANSIAAGLAVPALHTSAFSKMSFPVGKGTVQIVSDGHLELPTAMVLGRVPDADRSAFLAANNMSDDVVRSSLNLTLYRDGERTVLFDVGSGPNFMPSAGKLGEALEAADIAADDVTHVVFTHAHPDHIWGVLDDFDELMFSNAEYMMSVPEWDYWFNPETVNIVPENRQSFAVGARRNMAAIEDRCSMFKAGEEILPGIAAVDTAGHTPGHTSFHLNQGSDSVMVIGDVITNALYSFSNPDWEMGTDSDAAQGVKARKLLLDRMAAEKMQIIGYHLPHPGTGYVERKGAAYAYVAS